MLGSLVLAGIGCALMSNPGKKRKVRRAKKRGNPGGYWVLMKRTSEGPRYVAGPNSTTHDPAKATKFITSMGAQLRRTEWLKRGSGFKSKQLPASNPRRTTKKSKHRTSPGSAASRLAHWRWHHNPKPRNLEEHTFRRGTTTVRIATWRNANATAFIIVETGGPHGVEVWEAKSQGPSSGGFNKAHQAAERVYHAIAGSYPTLQGQKLLEEIADVAAAKVASRSNPRKRRKARRK